MTRAARAVETAPPPPSPIASPPVQPPHPAMKTNPLALFCLLGLATALPAQAPDDMHRPPIQNRIDLTADYALVQREPDALWGLGRDYSVRFHDDRVVFLPVSILLTACLPVIGGKVGEGSADQGRTTPPLAPKWRFPGRTRQ